MKLRRAVLSALLLSGALQAYPLPPFGALAMLPNAVRNAASLHRGTIAPGAAFRLDPFNLTETTQSSAVRAATLAGVSMQVLDRTAALSLCC
jgi:hypothetical protein